MPMDYTRRDLLALIGTAGALTVRGAADAQVTAGEATPPLAGALERNDAAVRALLPTQITELAQQLHGIAQSIGRSFQPAA